MALSDDDKLWFASTIARMFDGIQGVLDKIMDELEPEDPNDPEDPPDPPEDGWRPDPRQWKVTLPIGEDEDPTEFYPFLLSPPFVVGRQDGVLFRCPVNGVTTEGSDYPRAELREMANGEKAAWSNRPGEGEHHLAAHMSITETPVAKPHVVAAQIHDDEDDVVMVRLEGNRLFVEWNDGDEGALLDEDYQLGTPFDVAFWAGNGRIHVSYNGELKFNQARTIDGGYFKAGAYVQSNPSKGDAPTAAGAVVIHSLTVTHR